MTQITNRTSFDKAQQILPIAPKPLGAHPAILSNGRQMGHDTPMPPVQKSRLKGRHYLVLFSLFLAVIAPSFGAGYYLWAVAADQFVSRVGFTVRQEDTSSAIDLLGGLTSLSATSSSDNDILHEFIHSQKLVSDVDQALDLKQLWSRPQNDVIFSIQSDAAIEQLGLYWNRMVRISTSRSSGLIEVEVRAFDPVDAKRIAETVFDMSSRMINALSSIAQEDAVRHSRDELEAALERLREARAQVTAFRNQHQLVNPALDLKTQSGLMGALQVQQAETVIEIDLLRDTVRETDPRLETAKKKLGAIQARLDVERQKLGMGNAEQDPAAFASIVGEYERLVVDREFAERTYVTALAEFDAAKAEARRQSRYLAAYMQPTQAETPEYPRRLMQWLFVTLFLFLVWSIAVLIGYSIKDRR